MPSSNRGEVFKTSGCPQLQRCATSITLLGSRPSWAVTAVKSAGESALTIAAYRQKAQLMDHFLAQADLPI